MRRLVDVVALDPWQRAAAHQRPSQVWQHANSLSAYQVWTCYRIATKQLNLYHSGRRADNSCRALSSCQGLKETSAHIFWECAKARACWRKLIGHWTGVRDGRPALSNTSLAGMNRQAPALPARQRLRIHHKLPEDSETGVAVWDRLWFIMSSICLTHLSCERNDAVFRGKQTAALQSAERFWEVGIRHLNAVAKREHRGPDTAVAGAVMHTCIDLFTLAPRDGTIYSGESYDQPPIPELLSWLGSFQTSCA